MRGDISFLNPTAKIIHWDDLETNHVVNLSPSTNKPKDKMDHQKSHWASCSVDLPNPLSSDRLKYIMSNIPDSILRVKGCTRLDSDDHYSYFERVPSGDVSVRTYYGDLIMGFKLLVIGPVGRTPTLLNKIVSDSFSRLA